MSVDKKIYLASPHMCGLEDFFIKEAFETNWIAPLGPNVDAFEKEVADMVDIKAAAALSSGTAALHMALKYLRIGLGDVVFCSSLTFAASCNPIIYENAEPVFIDSEPESWNMSPRALEKALRDYAALGNLPKAVIVVNLYGQTADMDSITALCSSYNVPVIEDAAESLGAKYKGKHSGTFGYLGIYSFNGNKIITTSGGGMLISHSEAAIEKVKFWATQSRDSERFYQHTELGYNYRLSNVLAGIGRGQLRVLDQRIKEKRNIYETYKKAFCNIPQIEMMPVVDYGEPNYWLSVMTIEKDYRITPLDIILELEKYNIESRPVWKPMQLQPIFKDYKFYSHNNDGSSVSEDIFDRGVCLPSDTKMTEEDIKKIIVIIKKLFAINELSEGGNDADQKVS